VNELNNLTNSIADAYLSYCGRDSNSKAFLSPQEYLMFRSQAMEELKYGLHQGKAEDLQKEEPSGTNQITAPKETVNENKAAQAPTVSYEKEDNTAGSEPERKETPGIIQIPTKKTSAKTEDDKLLAFIQRFEG